MENLVFLVKSYHKHIDHTNFLIERLKKHNVDQIKTYLAIPKKRIRKRSYWYLLLQKS